MERVNLDSLLADTPFDYYLEGENSIDNVEEILIAGILKLAEEKGVIRENGELFDEVNIKKLVRRKKELKSDFISGFKHFFLEEQDNEQALDKKVFLKKMVFDPRAVLSLEGKTIKIQPEIDQPFIAKVRKEFDQAIKKREVMLLKEISITDQDRTQSMLINWFHNKMSEVFNALWHMLQNRNHILAQVQDAEFKIYLSLNISILNSRLIRTLIHFLFREKIDLSPTAFLQLVLIFPLPSITEHNNYFRTQ